MTHNPYTEADIYNWEHLHNNDSCQVTIGIYGKNNDKDKNSKIKIDSKNAVITNANIYNMSKTEKIKKISFDIIVDKKLV